MSRVNIIVSFKIYSLTDTYYAVGSSLTGSFGPFKLGKGSELYVGDYSALDDQQIKDFEGTLQADGSRSGGQSVSKVIPLGESYGDFKIRLYAENDLGIRSPYVEADKLIVAPDVTGTFRFAEVFVRNLKHGKPSAFEDMIQAPNKENNVLKYLSEFIGKEFTLQWLLKAPYGISGNAKGLVDGDSDFLDHFEIEFYKRIGDHEEDFGGEAVANKWALCAVPSSFNAPISAASLSAYYSFSLSLTQDQITELYGEETREVYIKILGKDVYHSSQTTVEGERAHEFSALVSLENKKTQIESCFAELYGKNLEITYVNRDPDFDNTNLSVAQYVSDAEYGTYSFVGSKKFDRGQLIYEQKWSSPSNPRFYKYILSLSDSYGFCGYHGVKVPGGIGDHRDLGADAIADATPLESFIQIGNVQILEAGDAFRLSWQALDSRGHEIELSEDEFRIASSLGGNKGTNVDELKGFTCSFECPPDYSETLDGYGRDAFSLSRLADSDPDAYSGGKPKKSITPSSPLEVVNRTSFFLDRETNSRLYKSWFNEHNPGDRRAPGDSLEPLRKLYKQQTGNTVVAFNSVEKEVDAQRKIKIKISLVNKNGEVVDVQEYNGYNSPPSIVDSDKFVNAGAGRIDFSMPFDEAVNFVRVYRRPHVSYDWDEEWIKVSDPSVTKTLDEWLALPLTGDVDSRDDYEQNPDYGGLSYKPRADGVSKGQDEGVASDSSYNSKTASFFGTDTSREVMLYNSGLNTQDEYEHGSQDGFYVGVCYGAGNKSSAASLVVGGNPLNKGEQMTVTDNPPILRRHGMPIATQYDYLLIPYDDFGSGHAWDAKKQVVPSPDVFSRSEDGALGFLDFDAPTPPGDLDINNLPSSFLLDWDSSLADFDKYNLIYIRDARSKSERLGALTKITTSIDGSDINPINFNTTNYSWVSSEFHSKDLKYRKGDGSPIAEWVPSRIVDGVTLDGYAKDSLVSYRPVERRTQSTTLKQNYLWLAVSNTGPSDIPGEDSEKWSKRPQAQVWDNGQVIYDNEIVSLDRNSSTSGSPTYNLIFWSSGKTYEAGDIAFLSGKCFRSLSSNNTGLTSDSALWEEVDGVSIQEIDVSASLTSLDIGAKSSDVGYFFLEAIDRAGNRSRLHADPTKKSTDANTYHAELGKTSLLDVTDFEKNLSEKFPDAIMLRPNDPFSILGNATLKWKSHYIYNDGKAHFVEGGEISLGNDKFTMNSSRVGLAEDHPFKTDQFIGYVYWHKDYGYDVVDGKFKLAEEVGETAIRDNAGDTDSGIDSKEADETFKHIARYSFCTGNPASNTYNLRTNPDHAYPSWANGAYDKGDKVRFAVGGKDFIFEAAYGTSYEPQSPVDYTTLTAWADQGYVDGDKVKHNDIAWHKVGDGAGEPGVSGWVNITSSNVDWVLLYSEPASGARVSSIDVSSPVGDVGFGYDDLVELLNDEGDFVAHIHNNTEVGDDKEGVGMGAFGMHIPISDKIGTQDERALQDKDGNGQIARVDFIDGKYTVTHNFVVFNNATIGKAWIDDASINSAQIVGLGADKIEAGVIESQKIEIGGGYRPINEDGESKDGQASSKDSAPNATPGVGDYTYGAITSEGFDWNTVGRPGFFISGDGQFGFQTKNGGLYLRGDDSGEPAELVVRGTLVQENSDPFLKMEMSATAQSLTFDEHAPNHYYYQDGGDWKVYGTESSIISPSDGKVTVNYSIQNARHHDGKPYAGSGTGVVRDQIKFSVYPDGDRSSPVGQDELEQIMYGADGTFGIGLVDATDLNKGGSFVLDFFKGKGDDLSNPDIMFTGAAVGQNTDVKSALDDLDLNDDDAPPGDLYPLADSYTVEMSIISKVDTYSESKAHLKGDLVKHTDKIFRCVQFAEKEDKPEWKKADGTYITQAAYEALTSGQGDYAMPSWECVDGDEVVLETKSVTINRIDRPANLSKISLIPQNGTFIKNGNTSDTLTVHPVLRYGTEDHSLVDDDSGLDWVSTIRDQLAIYQEAPFQESATNKEYKLISAAKDNSSFKIDAQHDNIINGKAKYVLVDRGHGVTFGADYDAAAWANEGFAVIDSVELLDMNDGKAVGVISVTSDHQFVTREFEGHPWNRLKLIDETSDAQLQFYLPIGEGDDTTLLTEDITVEIDADAGKYIEQKDIKLKLENNQVFGYADNTAAAASTKIFFPLTKIIGVNAVEYGKARVSFTVDHKEHVSEIKLKSEFVKTKNTTVVINNWDDFDGKDIFTAEESIYITTNIPADPSFKLSILKPFITYHPESLDKQSLCRVENMGAMQLFAGPDNVTKEVTSYNSELIIVPDFGFVVDGAFLNTGAGVCFPNSDARKAQALIQIKNLKASSAGLDVGTSNFFYNHAETRWEFSDPDVSADAKINTNGEAGKDYLYFIPEHDTSKLNSQAENKLTISVAYTRGNVDVGTANDTYPKNRAEDALYEHKTFRDKETISVVKILEGYNKPFVVLDNQNVELPLNYDGSMEKLFNFQGAAGKTSIKGYVNDVQIGIVPDKIIVDTTVFDKVDDSSPLRYTNSSGVTVAGLEPLKFQFGNEVWGTLQTLKKFDARESAENVTEIKIGGPTDQQSSVHALGFYDVNGKLQGYSDRPVGYTDGMLEAKSNSKIANLCSLTSSTKVSNDLRTEIVDGITPYYEHTLQPGSGDTTDDGWGTALTLQGGESFVDESGNPYFAAGANDSVFADIDVYYYRTNNNWEKEADSDRVRRKFSARRTGHHGSTPTYRGKWKVGEVYHGTKTRRDLVFHGTGADKHFYIASEGAWEGSNHKVPGDETSGFTAATDETPGVATHGLWQEFGAKYTAVATSLLLADDIFVKRGIVAGIDDSADGFFASQIDDKYFSDIAQAYELQIPTSSAPAFGVTLPSTPKRSYDDGDISANNSDVAHNTDALLYQDENFNQITKAAFEVMADGTEKDGYSRVYTTHKLPFAPVPGFFLGYHDYSLIPDKISDSGGVWDSYIASLGKVPMFDFTSPTRMRDGVTVAPNYIRWDGFRMRMFGAVINGSIEDSAVDVRIGSSGAASVKFNVPIYGGQTFCGGGFANSIEDNHSHLGSVIVGGGSNRINTNSGSGGKFSFIGGGYGNSIQNEFSFIGSGFGNMIGASTDNSSNKFGGSFNSIVSGRSNRVYDSSHSFIGTGFGNAIDGTMYSSIVNGENNYIEGSKGRDYLNLVDSTTLGPNQVFQIDSVDQVFSQGTTNGQSIKIEYQRNWSINHNRRALINSAGEHVTIKAPSGAVGHGVANSVYKVYFLDNLTVQKTLSVNGEDKNYYVDAMILDDGSGWCFITDEEEVLGHEFHETPDNFNLSLVKPEPSKAEWEDIRGWWEYFAAGANPFMYSASGANWILLKPGVNSRLEWVVASAVESAQNAAPDGGNIVPVTFQYSHKGADAMFSSGAAGKIPTDPTLLSLADIPKYKKLLDNIYSEPTDAGDYAFNTIAGGNNNFINRSSNTCMIGSSGSVAHHLKGGVVGGLNNFVVGRVPESNWSSIESSKLTLFGSENIFNYNTYDPASVGINQTSSIKSSVIGSENTVFGSRRTVVFGSGNQIKGADYSTDTTNFSRIKGQEVNIFGTDNEVVVPGGFANNLSIFGSNFKLRTQEQITNAYYFGNPKAESQVLARLFFAADGGAYFTGDVITFALSDAKHKTNVSTIGSPLKKIMSLRGVYFDWKDTQNLYSGSDIGVIAQEISEVLPEVVQDRNSGMGVKYEKITPLLIEGIKAQQETINELLSRVEYLESRID